MSNIDGAKRNVKEPKFCFVHLRERPRRWCADGIPFIGVYGSFIVALAAIAAALPENWVKWELLLVLVLPSLAHFLLYLATHWFVEVRCFVRFQRVKELDIATHIKVSPLNKLDKVLVAPIIKTGTEVSFSYLSRKFVYNSDTHQFERLKFRTTRELDFYLKSMGSDELGAAKALEKYGLNNFDIPLPTFSELFKEHAVAPFFVFQIFCVTLWLMDEYWYYSLLTLFMLVILECQVIQRRLHDLSELRAMRIPPRLVSVFRANSWKQISSDQLVPGDILAVHRGEREAQLNCPCDVLLLSGNALLNEAMLTGESVPQMKVPLSVAAGSDEAKDVLDMKGKHKQCIISAGTSVMLHENHNPPKAFKKVPGNGCVGYVLRTGFDTTQGKLVRTILFSAERVTVSSKESYYFLLILLMFAVVACMYILYDGLVVAPELWAAQNATMESCIVALNFSVSSNATVTNESDDNATNVNNTTNPFAECEPDKPRSTFKLVLAVSHILTSVVPPEFPITLTLAVNLSLVALVKYRIFCTEPFRVPLAGKVGMCCFDKTGTLTSDAMDVDCVEGLGADYKKPKAEEGAEGPVASAFAQPLPFMTTAVMAACSSLSTIDGEVVGDPLEKAALQAVRWQLPSPGLFVSKIGKGADRLQILARNPFASELQRMSVLVKHTGFGIGYAGTLNTNEEVIETSSELCRPLALVKGSAEALRPMLREVPASFDKLSERLAMKGLRVICLAAKTMPDGLLKGRSDFTDVAGRSALECDLEFCGLLVLRNAVKPNSLFVVRSLRRSFFRVMMITGDHPLTACQVALDIGMADRQFLTLTIEDTEAVGAIKPRLVWRARDAQEKSENYSVAFDANLVPELARRHSLCIPGKSLELLSEEQLKISAEYVSVFARVTPQQKQQVILSVNGSMHTLMVGDGTNDVGALKHAHVGVSLLSRSPELHVAQQSQLSQRSRTADLDGMMPLVRLGDASIASPFTYKGDTVKCCLQILRCGRATLSTVLMMYKIMGLNSVLSAFAMSTLTLDGVKFGDGQATIESIYISACFFLVSRNAPAKKLARQEPISSVFHWSVLLSLGLQLGVHLTVLVVGWKLATSNRSPGFRRNLEGEFSPNLTNTIVFYLTSAMHISSFIANYEGMPFMQPMRDNRALMYSIVFFVGTLFLAASDAIPELNDGLSVVLAPSDEVRNQILVLLAADIVGACLLARAVTSIATHLRGKAAEKRARELGLCNDDDGEDNDRRTKKSRKRAS